MVEGGAVCLGDSEMSWNRSRCLPLGTCPWRKHWADNNQHEHSSSQAGSRRRRWRAMDGGREGGDSHQQAGLTTGTVAYNDQLSTDFRHGDEG
jgi:hypothetical protein